MGVVRPDKGGTAMAAKRIDMHRLQEMVRLFRQGNGYREIARLLHMSPNTERPYREALLAAGLLGGDVSDLPSLEVLQTAVREHFKERVSPQQTSSIAIWEPLIEKKLEKAHVLFTKPEKTLRNRKSLHSVHEASTTTKKTCTYTVVNRLLMQF